MQERVFFAILYHKIDIISRKPTNINKLWVKHESKRGGGKGRNIQWLIDMESIVNQQKPIVAQKVHTETIEYTKKCFITI